MKKFISVIISLLLLFSVSVNVFADSEKPHDFETAFADQMPTYVFNSKEFEVGKTYVMHVDAPFSSDQHIINEIDFRALRGIIVKEDIVCNNVEITSVEEDDDFNFNILFVPLAEGEFSMEITMRSYGYDYTSYSYDVVEDDEWTYVITTDKYQAVPFIESTSSNIGGGNSSNNVATGDNSQTASNQNTSSGDSVDSDTEGNSNIFVWVIVIVALIACAVVGILLNKKKLIK